VRAGLLVKRLTGADAAAYRALMLEAYEQAADAFTSTAEERALEPLSWWARRIGGSTDLNECFGAFLPSPGGPTLVGTVALEYSAKPKTRHAALVIGMYVQPTQRGAGVGRALLQAAIDTATARPGVLALRLTLTEGNLPALRLYEAAGFVAWGTEPQAILSSAGLVGKVHMHKVLARPSH
jgi:GNAT superfamily N-acetyltransferase